MISLKEVLGIPCDINFLIVEDTAIIRQFPVKELKKLGFTGNIIEASSGNEAFIKLEEGIEKNQPISFIISDLMMKDGSGLELLTNIRQDNRFKRLPFLLLTTESEKSTVLNCIKAGASNYLLKPWTSTEFQDKISFCWKKHLFDL